MANRNKHFRESVLYHGSDYMFKPGETVLPGKDGVAWASTNRSVAAGYGANVYRVQPNADDVVRHPGAAKEFGIYYSKTGYNVQGRDDEGDGLVGAIKK